MSIIGKVTEQTNTARLGLAKAGGIATKGAKTTLSYNNIGANIGYMSSNLVKDNTTQGEIVSTTVSTDLAIQGSGYFVVQNMDNKIPLATRAGSFRLNSQDGYYVNSGGYALLGWEYDAEGNLPLEKALLTSLKPVDLAATKGAPKATTEVSLSMNLSATTKALRGPGVNMSMQRTGLNASTGKISKNDIIFPEKLTGSKLTLGDSISITSTPPNQAKTITYGGIAIAKAPSSSAKIFGSQKFDQSFAFGNSANQIIPDSRFKITVDGTTYTFTAKAAAPSIHNMEFNSVKTLADAINSQTKLKARIDTNGNLYIAPVNADNSVTFTNSDGSAIKDVLGLIDIPASGGEGIRFNSLDTLEQAINFNQENFGFKGTIEEGKIDLTALLATSSFEITGQSRGVMPIGYASFGNNTVKGQATATISAPKNSLVAGDYVKITGLGNAHLPDGVYYVSSADNNSFTVNLLSVNPNVVADGTITNGYPAVAAAQNLVVNPLTSSWQKVAGMSYESNTSTAIVAAGGANGVVTITCAGHGLANNDVIHISSSGRFASAGRAVNLPDGYYIVGNVAGNNFDIKPSVDTGGAIDPLTHPAVGGADITFKKIGVTAPGNYSGAPPIDNIVMATTGGVGSNLVKLYLGNKTYSVGDMIHFTGLVDPYVIDGITLTNNTNYKVTEVDANYVTFEVFGADGTTPAVATTGDGVVDAKLHSSADMVQFEINHFSRMFEYFGIDQSVEAYGSRYDPTNASKSLASGIFDGDGGVFTHPVTMFDSLGTEFSVMIKGAKLDNNKWAIEIVASSDETNGIFLGLGADKLIQAGVLNFDVDGNYSSNIGLDSEILVNRNNGSNTTRFNINWGSSLSVGSKGTITQFGSPNAVEFVKQNGQSAGTLETIEIDAAGDIIAKFSNGSSKKVFRIPVITVINPNGIEEVFGDAVKTTLSSGPFNLKSAGTNGSGQIISGALEKSNIDTTSSLIELSETMQHLKLVSRGEAKRMEIDRIVLDEMSRS